MNREKRGGGVGKGSCQNSSQRFTKTKKSDEMFKEQRLTKLIITALCKLGKPRHSLPFRNDCSKAFPPPFSLFLFNQGVYQRKGIVPLFFIRGIVSFWVSSVHSPLGQLFIGTSFVPGIVAGTGNLAVGGQAHPALTELTFQ